MDVDVDVDVDVDRICLILHSQTTIGIIMVFGKERKKERKEGRKVEKKKKERKKKKEIVIQLFSLKKFCLFDIVIGMLGSCWCWKCKTIFYLTLFSISDMQVVFRAAK